jgi:hypothetical protein
LVNPPKKGTTKEQFNRNFLKRVFYHYSINNNIRPCIIYKGGYYDSIFVDVQFFNSEWVLLESSSMVTWELLFESYQEAAKYDKHIKKLYSGFFAKPYVNTEILEKHKGQLRYIEKEIGKNLKSYPNFKGIDFCDVHAGGIQIRGHHKDIKGYCFGEQITIKYDFSNYKDTITQFVDMWKSLDNDSYISGYKSFLADGERYGWD